MRQHTARGILYNEQEELTGVRRAVLNDVPDDAPADGSWKYTPMMTDDGR